MDASDGAVPVDTSRHCERGRVKAKAAGQCGQLVHILPLQLGASCIAVRAMALKWAQNRRDELSHARLDPLPQPAHPLGRKAVAGCEGADHDGGQLLAQRYDDGDRQVARQLLRPMRLQNLLVRVAALSDHDGRIHVTLVELALVAARAD